MSQGVKYVTSILSLSEDEHLTFNAVGRALKKESVAAALA
jgi:hypothetical protein